MKKFKLFKLLVLLVVLITCFPQMWGAHKGSNSGFWDDGGLKVTFNINGTPSETTLSSSSPETTSLGTITTGLSMTKTVINFWTNYGTSATNSTVYWELYKSSTKIGSTYERTTSTAGTYSGSNSTYTVTTTTDILALTTGPGSYTVRVYAQFTSSEGTYWYNRNTNNGYYSFTFTIPSKNLTVNGAANGNTVSGSVNGITKGTAYDITATPTTGYTFGGWSTDDSHISIANTSSASTTVTFNNYSGNATVTATFNAEVTHTVTVSYMCTSPSKSIQTATTPAVGVTTHSYIDAPSITGYSFTGWTVGDGINNHSGGTGSSVNPIEITTKASGTYTLTANYNEVLTTSWKLIGDNQTGSPFGDNYAYASGKAMSKKTGYSTTDKAYKTLDVTKLPGSYYGFKVAIASGSSYTYGWGTNDGYYVTYDRSKSGTANDVYTGDQHELKFVPDALGEYEFEVDYTSTPCSVKVTFPATTYTVTYNIGSVAGTSGSISATYSSVAFASGTKVQSGKSVTLTGPAPKTGYTWKGWYTNAAGTEGKIEDVSRAITVTVNAAKSLYACYTENQYNTTVAVSPAGTKATTSPAAGTVAIKQITGTAITATAATDSIFEDWTISGGGLSMVSSSTTNPNTFKATSIGGTITANFTPQWTIAGSMYDNFNWSKTSNLLTGYNTVSSKKHATKTISLAANTTYTFKVKDRSQDQDNGWYGIASGSTATYTYANDNTAKAITTASGNQNISLTTAAAGDYVFDFNVTDKKIAVDFPTSYLITSGQKTFYNDDASSDATETGGTYTAVDNSSNNVKGANKYVASGASVTFTATPKTGYEFDGWYTNAECTTGKTMTNPLTVSSISANVTRYAKFKEIMTTVEINYTKIDDFYGETCGWVKVGGATKEPDSKIKVGVHTTVTLRMEADSTSHYYSSVSYWTHDDIEKTDSVGADYHCDLTLRGKGAGDDYQSIYVSFPQLEKIYFKNWNDETKTQLWDSVYVGFNPHYGDLGADVWGLSDDDVRAMRRDSEDDYNYRKGKYDYYCMWWTYVPRHMTRTGDKNIVFFDYAEMRGQSHFWKVKSETENGKAVYRTDYNKKNNMYVPTSTKSDTKNSGGCDYYSNGYWRNFWVSANEAEGYYLQKKTGTNTYEELGEFLATKGTTYTNEYLTEMEYTVRFDNTNAADFRIVSAGGEHYIANANLTSGSPESYLKSNNNDDASFRVTPTAEGNYVFKIVQSSDTMDISVEYPVAIGDYVLENVYNDGSERTARSNIIKASVAETMTRYSMYLSNAGGSATLKLRRCTEIDDSGNPVWSTGDDTNLSDVLTTVGTTPGVYQFDLTVDKSTNKVSDVDSLRLYSGNYYIKVDAAPGGWAGYTKNVMDKNSLGFDRTKSYTFDNYWCHYYSTGTGHNSNIKCVVANDYCNQLSDTLKQDSLHIAWMSGNEPYVPVDGTSIRFSYNSATNTINRSYLAAQDDDYYLDIKVYNSAKIYNDSDVDLYTTSFDNTWANRCRFTDTKDWVYEKTIKVIPGGKAGVVAKYQGVSQTFLPDTTTLIGSPDASSTKYTIRLVYDFKTNYMMSSFMIDDETTIIENLSDFDMLWVRHKNSSATQLKLGGSTKLTNVRVIGAIELRYDSVHYQSTEVGHVDVTRWTPESRPYLKYFLSFPFDVPVNNIFGLNQADLGREYIIQGYNGAKRAEKGLFGLDGNNYWEYLTLADTMYANQGYYVIFDNDYVSGTRGQIWENKSEHSSVYLYFPAAEPIAEINSGNGKTTTAASHECKIDRPWAGSYANRNHLKTDSHWNTIGSPYFHDSYIKDTTASDTTKYNYPLESYYYLDDSGSDVWYTQAIDSKPMFKAMSAVLIQWYGTITWTTDSEQSNYHAVPRKTQEDKHYLAKLELHYNGSVADWAYVKMQDGAEDDFVLCEDMLKVYNKSISNIYTFADDYDVAFNNLPIKSQTIPVGVLIRKNGTYSFSMPENISGTVTLVDKFDGTRTNLAMEDYEVYLEKGTIEDRFELEINVNKMPTAIDGAEDGSGSLKDGKAHKFIENGVMYILENGRIYDAQGNRVK